MLAFEYGFKLGLIKRAFDTSALNSSARTAMSHKPALNVPAMATAFKGNQTLYNNYLHNFAQSKTIPGLMKTPEGREKIQNFVLRLGQHNQDQLARTSGKLLNRSNANLAGVKEPTGTRGALPKDFYGPMHA